MAQQEPLREPFPMLARLKTWGIHACARCPAKVLTTSLPKDAIHPPGWEIRYGFRQESDELVCDACLAKPKPESRPKAGDEKRTVQTFVEPISGGVRVECLRCGYETQSRGTSDRSIRRCFYLLSEKCPREERNFYTEGGEDATKKEEFVGPDDDEDEDDEGEGEEDEEGDDEEDEDE